MANPAQILRKALGIVDNSFQKKVKKKAMQFAREDVNKGLDRALTGKGKGSDAYLEAMNSNALKATTVGLATGAGALIAFKNDKVDLGNTKTSNSVNAIAGGLALLAGGAVGARGMRTAAKKLLREDVTRGHFRVGGMTNYRQHLSEDAFHNTFTSFYGPKQKIASLAEEGIYAGKRYARTVIDPAESYATKVSGIAKFAVDDIDTYRLAATIADDKLAKLAKAMPRRTEIEKLAYNKEAKKIWKPMHAASKVLHNEMIQNWQTPILMGKRPSKELQKWASSFVDELDIGKLRERHKNTIGEDALKNLIEVQSTKRTPINIDNTKILYHEISNKGLKHGGDVLRGIQFDDRAWNFFTKIQPTKVDGETVKMTTEYVTQMAKDAGFKNIKLLKNGRVQIIMSPQGKTNFHWGGYAGTMVWDPNKQRKLAVMADDLGDLFGVKIGKNTIINTSPSRIIKIPDALKERPIRKGSKIEKGEREAFVKRIEDSEIKTPDRNTAGKSTPYSQADYENLVAISDRHKNVYTDSIPSDEKFKLLMSRAGAMAGSGGALYGYYALALDDD